ncbi:UDP-glucose 4-epimerase GalE [Cognatishimia maritima]|uniref:UDP-glucose 4-epimerase n=1 Tax=Cognatishimia maritima TaxID=870908 RepID=A0A1M5IFP0_9RHOB|nr:UDP-glucose 4-epimerase GalE [Cognatishimia maritima]SHG27077.1 UDP-glucose 4-epimerase [Cognatishimia maritima]
MRILLTGGAGYIGSHTYVALCAAGHTAVILDNFSNAAPSVPERLAQITGTVPAVETGDVRDADFVRRVLKDHEIDAVIHFAAKKAVGESTQKPLEYFDHNIGGFVTLTRAMAELGIFKLVFSSSATVYGEPDQLPITETATRGHTNPYGMTKLVCEEMIEAMSAADPRWICGVLRYFNPVGADESAMIGEDPKDIPNNLMPYIAKVAAGELPEVQVFGDDYQTEDGTGVRDYIHVSDLAQGHVLSLEALERDGTGHVVNLGTGQGVSVLEMINAYSEACGRPLPYKIAPRRAGDIAACYADPSLAKEVLGFSATKTLQDMCDSSWAWLQYSKTV